MNLLQMLFGNAQGQTPAQNGPQQQMQQQQQLPQGQQQAQQQQNSQLPSEPGNFPTPKNELDVLADLLQNSTTQQNADFRAFSLPREKLTEAASKMNFTQNLPPEIMQGLQSGDMQAIMNAINFVGQQSYLQSMEHGMALTNQYLGDRFTHERDGINKHLKLEMQTSNVEGLDKLHPLAQDMFRRAQQNLINKFPTATKAEIEEATWQLMGSFGNQLNRESAANPLAAKPKALDDIDWDQAGGFAEANPSGPTMGA